MKEIEFDEFFKDNFDTTGIEDNIYNQIAKDLARGIDIDLAKTPLVDILTGYTRYKIQELEIERLKDQLNDEIKEELKQSEIMVKKQQEVERLNNIIKEVREYIKENVNDELDDFTKIEIGYGVLEILDKGE